jgi:hypothetical protein
VPAEDGWHLSYIALTPPGLQAGTAVFELALGSRVLRNRTAELSMCPTELCQTDTAALVVFADGLNTTLARPEASPTPIGSASPGGATAGFMSAWAVGQTDRFRAALVGAGVIDLGHARRDGGQRPVRSRFWRQHRLVRHWPAPP